MIDIFIKTYHKDFKFLNYCLKSIEKFATGYNQVVIIVPEKDLPQLTTFVNIPNINVKIVTVNECGDGYLYQQWVKMSAHLYCDSEFIMYVDSDCLFHFPVDLAEVVKNKKPEILYTDYSKVGDAVCWKAPTERFMNDTVEYEFMRRNGLIYHRSTIETILNLEPNLENIIMNSTAFSEFNAMGAWAFKNEKHKYNFVNTDNWQYTEPIVKQFWSWGGVEKVENEIKQLLTN